MEDKGLNKNKFNSANLNLPKNCEQNLSSRKENLQVKRSPGEVPVHGAGAQAPPLRQALAHQGAGAREDLAAAGGWVSGWVGGGRIGGWLEGAGWVVEGG